MASNITQVAEMIAIPGAPEREAADWLVKLQNKAATKANATSGALYTKELNLLKAAYGRYIAGLS